MTKNRLAVSSERMPHDNKHWNSQTRNLKCGHESQKGLHTKTDWLTISCKVTVTQTPHLSPEYGDIMFLWNVCMQPKDYMAQQPRRPPSISKHILSLQSSPQEISMWPRQPLHPLYWSCKMQHFEPTSLILQGKICVFLLPNNFLNHLTNLNESL
jgi:hypothetical protein